MEEQNKRLSKIFGYLMYRGFISNKSTQKDLSDKIDMDYSNISKAIKGEGVHPKTLLSKINKSFGDIFNEEWLITGNGEMLKEDLLKPQEESNLIKSDLKKETRIRIPLNAAAGSISVALDGVTSEDCENLPVIESFAKYNYTILVKGDSMEPEFHSGDELACLFINGKSSFVQWGNFHVLDTSQGIIVKRIYDDDEYILCVSENKQLFPDFRIHKSEIYSISLVIGMLRRY